MFSVLNNNNNNNNNNNDDNNNNNHKNFSTTVFFFCLPTGTGTYPMLVLELLKQVNRQSYPFATLELRKNLGQVRRAKTSGIVTGDAPLAIFFSLSLVTVPEVFAKVNLSQFPFSF